MKYAKAWEELKEWLEWFYDDLSPQDVVRKMDELEDKHE